MPERTWTPPISPSKRAFGKSPKLAICGSLPSNSSSYAVPGALRDRNGRGSFAISFGFLVGARRDDPVCNFGVLFEQGLLHQRGKNVGIRLNQSAGLPLVLERVPPALHERPSCLVIHDIRHGLNDARGHDLVTVPIGV